MTLLPPLIRAHVYVLRDDRPVFIRTIIEGDIAFHGFRLKASHCTELANVLWELNSNGLWEYSRGFGVTMEDSALVIDGLIDSGWDSDALKNSVDLLISHFYAPDDGAFHTLFKGRSKYWLGPSLEANAFAVYFIEKLAIRSQSEVKKNALEYILKQPFSPSGWKGRWFHQQAISNYYVLRALAAVGKKRPNLISILNHMLQSQAPDGSWNMSIISTSLNALSISYLVELIPDSFAISLNPLQAILNAESWLRSGDSQDKQSEPILYYWYEAASLISGIGNRKIFYHCEDMGEIGDALRKFSLREIGLRFPGSR